MAVPEDGVAVGQYSVISSSYSVGGHTNRIRGTGYFMVFCLLFLPGEIQPYASLFFASHFMD